MAPAVIALAPSISGLLNVSADARVSVWQFGFFTDGVLLTHPGGSNFASAARP
jgi:hypothetical protein